MQGEVPRAKRRLERVDAAALVGRALHARAPVGAAARQRCSGAVGVGVGFRAVVSIIAVVVAVVGAGQ